MLNKSLDRFYLNRRKAEVTLKNFEKEAIEIGRETASIFENPVIISFRWYAGVGATCSRLKYSPNGWITYLSCP
jgi:hypothetical protein